MKIKSIAAVVLGLALSSTGPSYAVGSVDPSVSAPAGLELVAYDGFDYPVGNLSDTNGTTGANGGIGWTSSWTQGWPFQVSASSLTYTDLTSHGGKAYYARNAAIGYVNSYSAGNRSLPRQNSGIVYLQFLSDISLNNGGGAPEVRLNDNGVTTAAIGNNGEANIDILDGSLDVHKGSSGTPILGLHLNIVRIDYSAQTTKLWVDPTLATFDYMNPPAANATVTSFAPAFDQLTLITKGGAYDEVTVMRISPLPAAPTGFTASSGNKMLHLRWHAPASSTVTGYKMQYKEFGDSQWLDGIRGCSPEETADTEENCNMSGLQNDVRYDVRVASVNDAGQSDWVTATGTPTAPGRQQPSAGGQPAPRASGPAAAPRSNGKAAAAGNAARASQRKP